MLKRSTKKARLASVVILAAMFAGTAQAADLPTRKPPVLYSAPLPVFSWTGLYAGVNIGGGFAQSRAFGSYLGSANSGSFAGVVGGGQAGYNYQLSPLLVVGVENDFLFTTLKTDNTIDALSRVSVPFLGTGRGRAGLALLDSKLLVYGTAGLASGQVHDTGVDKLRLGWTAGGGVEWAFLPNWSAKIEYLYIDLNKDLKNEGLPSRSQKFHTVRVGVNYHFDLLKPTSLTKPY